MKVCIKRCFIFTALILTLSGSVFSQNNKAQIVHPEFFELFKVAISLTDFSKENENMTAKSGEYFTETQKYFASQAKHPLILQLNEAVKKDYGYYISNRSYALNFYFEDEKIKEADIVSPMTKIQANFLGNAFKNLSLWEDFAEKSKFREFFAGHKTFYQKRLEAATRNLPLEKIQIWLEREFPERYDRYTIVVSPLIGGTHSTNRANFQGANQCFMFVSDSSIYEALKLTPKQIEGLYTGVVFTEIDHNYNNPVSVKSAKDIEKAMPEIAKWSNGSEAKNGFYKTPLKIFDEYATYSIYLLYIYDNFSPKDYEFIRERKVNQIINNRGFGKFGEFHEEFLRFYKAKEKGEKIADLYPRIIDWVSKQT